MFNLIAKINNPAIAEEFGTQGTSAGPAIVASLIVTIWQVLILLGGLATLLYLMLGGIGWLTAGDDKTKVEGARNRITNAIIGMVILFSVVALVNFIGPAIGFDILALPLPNNLSTTPSIDDWDPF